MRRIERKLAAPGPCDNARVCGRYVLKASAIELTQQFHLDEVPPLSARYNIAPLQAAPIIQATAPKEPRRLTMAQWGLLPKWAKDASLAHQLINARVESLERKPAFKDLIATHRCVVPADGFYEWSHAGHTKQPHFIHPRTGGLLALAGLWSRWRSPDGLDVDTFTILTAGANDDLRLPEIAGAKSPLLHQRMPIFLDEPGWTTWLSSAGLDEVRPLLHSPPPGVLAFHAVGAHVNQVAFDDPRCLEPATTLQLRLL
ncbi:MAG: SOS response-associated peptidase [Myxococcaceae bacterium]